MASPKNHSIARVDPSYPLGAIHNFALFLIFPALPPKNRVLREEKKYKSPPCPEITPRRARPPLCRLAYPIPADSAPRSRRCSSTPLTSPAVISTTIGALPTPNKRSRCRLLTTRMAEGLYCRRLGVCMGRPNDASRTARGVLPSHSSPSTKFISGSPSDGGGEDSHPMNSRCDRKGDCFDFYPAAHSLGRRDA